MVGWFSGLVAQSKAVENNTAKMSSNNNSSKKRNAPRIWEIDALRGVAVLYMVLHHLLVDLRDFYGYDIVYYKPPWSSIGMSVAMLFMLVSGVSCSLSSSNIKRGIKVFLFGLAVTAVTYFYVRELCIVFGILHFMGSAIIIWGAIDRAVASSRAKIVLLSVLSPCLIILGVVFNQMKVESPYLFFLGLTTSAFRTYDYYPLLPWLGVFFIGVLTGSLFYKTKKKSLLSFGPADMPRPIGAAVAGIVAIGSKSIIIYFIHQPVLMAALFLIHI